MMINQLILKIIDELVYGESDVVKAISVSTKVTSRGAFDVPQLENYFSHSAEILSFIFYILVYFLKRHIYIYYRIYYFIS